jgi:hypothetical protein
LRRVEEGVAEKYASYIEAGWCKCARFRIKSNREKSFEGLSRGVES